MIDLAEINDDIRKDVDAAKAKVADALEGILPKASSVLTKLSNSKLAQAALAAEHLSPTILDTLAEFVTAADAEVAKLAGDSPDQVAEPDPVTVEETAAAADAPPVAEPAAVPAGPQVAGVA